MNLKAGAQCQPKLQSSLIDFKASLYISLGCLINQNTNLTRVRNKNINLQRVMKKALESKRRIINCNNL